MIGVHSGKFHGNEAPVRSSSEPKPVTPGEPKVLPLSSQHRPRVGAANQALSDWFLMPNIRVDPTEWEWGADADHSTSGLVLLMSGVGQIGAVEHAHCA